MKKREIREYLYNCGLNESDLKPYIKINGTRGKWKFTDTRTFKDNKGYYHVYPFGFTERQVYIVCPLCGETHFHGIGTDNNYQGHRVKHCREELIERPGEYIIEKLDPVTEKRLIKKHNSRMIGRYS